MTDDHRYSAPRPIASAVSCSVRMWANHSWMAAVCVRGCWKPRPPDRSAVALRIDRIRPPVERPPSVDHNARCPAAVANRRRQTEDQRAGGPPALPMPRTGRRRRRDRPQEGIRMPTITGRSMRRAGGACPGSVRHSPDAMVPSDGNPACVRAKCAPAAPVTAGPRAGDGRATVAGGSTRVLTRPGSGQVLAALPATAPTAERPRRRREVGCPLAYSGSGIRRVTPPARGGPEVGMHR